MFVPLQRDRKSTRLNSSAAAYIGHLIVCIFYPDFPENQQTPHGDFSMRRLFLLKTGFFHPFLGQITQDICASHNFIF